MRLASPQFQKYNLVCRASIDEAPQFMKDDLASSCQGNRYTTTLHVLNSLVVKCSKLTVASPVYRGSARGVLPTSFWEKNEQGVRGGVEVCHRPSRRSARTLNPTTVPLTHGD